LHLVFSLNAESLLNADPQFGTPVEFAVCVTDDLAEWTRLAKEAGLGIE
jgi:hypothetical protein